MDDLLVLNLEKSLCLNLWYAGSYNPLERREGCKGGKEATKKAAPSQSSTKSSTAAPKAQSSHNARRNEVSSANPANQPVKAARPSSSGGPAYDEKVLIQCRKGNFGSACRESN